MHMQETVEKKQTTAVDYYQVCLRLTKTPSTNQPIETQSCYHVGYLSVDPRKRGREGCPETSIINYYYLLCNHPEERISQLLHSGSLKYFTKSVPFPNRTNQSRQMSFII
jgi:hypothetical protein